MTDKAGKQPRRAAERGTLGQDWLVLLIWAASFIAGLMIYPRLHGPIAIHWNAYGKANGFASPLQAVLEVPLITLAVYALLVAVPWLDPRRASYERFGSTMRLLRWTMVLMMTAMHWLSLAPALGLPEDPNRFRQALIAALFVVMGNVLGLVRPTFFVGIRTPWTLADDRVWQKTHRMGGRLWVGAGLVGMATILLPKSIGAIIFVAALGTAALVPVVYSFLEYRRLHPASGSTPPEA